MSEEKVIKSYKGMSKNMTGYDDFQFEVGKKYEADGEIECCGNGFHACEAPLDVFAYYPPAISRYFEVEQSGDIDKSNDDTKVSSRKIKIGAEIGIPGLIKAHFEYVKAHTTEEHTDPKQATAGDGGAATAGERGAATAGDRGAATAGYRGAATAGYRGAATAGDSGAATAGDSGAATAGDGGAATAGDRGAATAGKYGAATAGNYGAATAGNYGAATAGDSGAATSRGKSKTGKNGICVARGNGVKVCGGIGSVLVAVEEYEHDYDILDWKCAVVDGEIIKSDKWYTLKNGEFVEVPE